MDDTEIDGIEFVVSDMDAAEAFQSAEESLDEVARPVGSAVQWTLSSCVSVGMRWRDQLPAVFSGALTGRPALISTVGDQLWLISLVSLPLDQRSTPRRIPCLPW